jgi:hypothetical protein
MQRKEILYDLLHVRRAAFRRNALPATACSAKHQLSMQQAQEFLRERCRVPRRSNLQRRERIAETLQEQGEAIF